MLKPDFDQRNRKNEKIDIFFHSLLFLKLKYKIFSGKVIETPTKPQFQPFFMPSKKVWTSNLSGAAVMERPDLSPPKKVVIVEI